MPSLKEVKNRINSVMSTPQITKAMKMVAAAKLRKSPDRILQMRPCAHKLTALLPSLSAAQSDGDTDNWYSQVRGESKVLLIVVTCDRGLCGSFNSNIFRAVNRIIEEKYASQWAHGNVTVLSIGKKSQDYFSKRKC